jgi:hypothetical protein
MALVLTKILNRTIPNYWSNRIFSETLTFPENYIRQLLHKLSPVCSIILNSLAEETLPFLTGRGKNHWFDKYIMRWR